MRAVAGEFVQLDGDTDRRPARMGGAWGQPPLLLFIRVICWVM